MKKFLITLISVIFIASIGFSQERTISKTMKENTTYYKYSGVTADTLVATNQDTIDFILTYQNWDYVKKLAIKSKFDLISGNDTTVKVSVFGREFSDDGTWVQIIASTTSSDINADNTVQVLTSDPYVTTAAYDVPFTNPTAGTADTLEYPVVTYTPFDKSYRQYRIRYIITAASGAGSGVKIDEIEFKVYTD